MTTESVSEELSTLLQQTQEHVLYFQELGVTGIHLETFEPAHPAEPNTHASSRYRVPQSQSSIPPTPPREIASRPHDVTQIDDSASLFGDTGKPAETLAPSDETLEQIWAELKDCTRCTLHEGRTNVVNTEGNSRARLMFVGEAPGADEDAQARPFVGRAGQLLTKIIEAIGFKREEVLIGNVNRCRPPGNRAPMPDEAATCKPFLLREIASVQPDVIVVMGNTAMKNLLDTKEGITRLRGKFQDFKGIKVMPTFHPAYLLRDPSKKRETWEDLKKVRDYLDSTAKRSE
jgi:uracil-DNA glycosylase family 4